MTVLSDSGLRVTSCVFKGEEQAACLPACLSVLVFWVLGTEHGMLPPHWSVVHITKPRLGQRSASLHKVSQVLAAWKLLEAESCILLELIYREVRTCLSGLILYLVCPR